MYHLRKEQDYKLVLAEAERLANVNGGDIHAESAVITHKYARAFETADNWLAEEYRQHHDMRVWPSMATSVPYNFRNNVPWDRVRRWKNSTQNTILLAGTKFFKRMTTTPDYGRVAISHVAACHSSGAMLMSVEVGLPNDRDVRRTGNNSQLNVPFGKALTEWGAGTALARLLGNDNRLVLWRPSPMMICGLLISSA
jgi:hypothetical protein